MLDINFEVRQTEPNVVECKIDFSVSQNNYLVGTSPQRCDTYFIQVGNNIEVNDDTEYIGSFPKFNPFNGGGLIVEYQYLCTPGEGYSYAMGLWGNNVRTLDFPDYSEIAHVLRRMLGGVNRTVFDYIIIAHGDSDGIDDVFKEQLSHFFPFTSTHDYHTSHEEMEQSDSKGNRYTIYYAPDYDYSKPTEPYQEFYSQISRQNQIVAYGL